MMPPRDAQAHDAVALIALTTPGRMLPVSAA
jgi:hypothetical protein